jgi:hypothetical protein
LPYLEDEFTTTRQHHCPDPYDVPADAPAPRSPGEAREFWDQAYNASKGLLEDPITVPWITASEWTVSEANFAVTADLSKVIELHGEGVYTVLVWALVDGETALISGHSIFHG